MTVTNGARRPRADAQRNRTHIVMVAAERFAQVGLDVSMDAIAKQAGVGPATLYRHFPSRDALVLAVLEDCGPDLVQSAHTIEGSAADAKDALAAWLRAVASWTRAYDGLPAPLRAALVEQTSLTPACEQIIATTDKFLKAAQRDGTARPDARATDLYLGTLAVAWAADAARTDTATQERLLATFQAGWEYEA